MTTMFIRGECLSASALPLLKAMADACEPFDGSWSKAALSRSYEAFDQLPALTRGQRGVLR